tara:strand:+ start:12615 stop:13634 length:1020 start_codon:yes stop_codon:yes gene_type:complete
VTTLSFPRQIGLKRSLCEGRWVWDDYLTNLNGKTSLYTSLYSFKETEGGKAVYDSAVIDRGWWDFDMNETYSMDEVKRDVAILLERLMDGGGVRLVATGRGFHVYQLFARPVVGRKWANTLDRYEREMADGLPTLDGVGYPEKLTRIPDTYNPKRGRWAVTIPPTSFLRDPHGYKIPNRPEKKFASLNPFTGICSNAFDLVRWSAENPISVGNKEEIREMPSAIVDTGADDVVLPTCLDKAIRVSNPPHHVRVALVQEMGKQLRWFAKPEDISPERREEMVSLICGFISTLGWLDYNPAITRKAAYSLIDYSRAPSPLWYRKHNLCNGSGCWFCEASTW